MIQGTTPLLKFKVKGADFSDLASLYLVFKQNSYTIVKLLGAVSVSEDTIITELTEEETLRFEPGEVLVQLRYSTNTNKTFATNIATIQVYPLLRGGNI